MPPLAGFEVIGHRGYYRPHGKVTLPEAISLLIAGTQHARSLGLRELLLDGNGLSAYEPPSILDRYQFITTLADIAAGAMRIAIVLPEEVLDPQRFGTLVATNRGLVSNVFTSEETALAWLDGSTH
jgi:L-ribulose-5-phosphate 3-epimerase UlaE